MDEAAVSLNLKNGGGFDAAMLTLRGNTVDEFFQTFEDWKKKVGEANDPLLNTFPIGDAPTPKSSTPAQSSDKPPSRLKRVVKS